MNKKTFLVACLAAVAFGVTVGFMPAKGISQKGDTTVVNTTTIASKVRGLNGATPVKIYIAKDKIVKIETLPNQESPAFFERAKAVLKAYNGKKVKAAAAMKADGVSGATYSSRALIKNVQQGLNYYQNNK